MTANVAPWSLQHVLVDSLNDEARRLRKMRFQDSDLFIALTKSTPISLEISCLSLVLGAKGWEEEEEAERRRREDFDRRRVEIIRVKGTSCVNVVFLELPFTKMASINEASERSDKHRICLNFWTMCFSLFLGKNAREVSWIQHSLATIVNVMSGFYH